MFLSQECKRYVRNSDAQAMDIPYNHHNDLINTHRSSQAHVFQCLQRERFDTMQNMNVVAVHDFASAFDNRNIPWMSHQNCISEDSYTSNQKNSCMEKLWKSIYEIYILVYRAAYDSF